MITKERCLDLIEDLLGIINTAVMKESRRLLDVGAVSLEQYENNFVLPKVILSTSLANVSFLILPPHSSPQVREDLAFLKLF